MDAKSKLSYFLKKREDQVKEFEAPESFKDEKGNPIMIKVRVLSQEEMDKIYENYSTKHIAREGKKKTPLVQNGMIVEKQVKDYGRAMRHLIAEAIIEPNFKSQECMEYFECYEISEIIYKVFPTPDEYNYVVNSVLEILGLSGDADDDEVKSAKN